MKKSKFAEAQITFALRQSETGTRVEEICRELGVSQATFFNWNRGGRKKYGGMGVTELPQAASVGGRKRAIEESTTSSSIPGRT